MRSAWPSMIPAHALVIALCSSVCFAQPSTTSTAALDKNSTPPATASAPAKKADNPTTLVASAAEKATTAPVKEVVKKTPPVVKPAQKQTTASAAQKQTTAPAAAKTKAPAPAKKAEAKTTAPAAQAKAPAAPGAPLVEKPQAAPPPAKAEPGKVLPTAAGGLGGATPYTRDMPLDLQGLVELRKPFIGRPELRGAWITRFDWIVKKNGQFDAAASRKKIVSFMETAKNIGLNTVFFQVRADATTLYPSKLEPWSQMIGGKDPGFDPLRFAISEAHKRKLEIHAYVNPVPVSEEKQAPANPKHIWYKHCTDQASPNWRVFEGGKPAPFEEYAWFNTNLPEVQTYIRTVMLDLVLRYQELDGIHFDRIRMPSAKVSDDPWSKARFNSPANPDKLSYPAWQADNITRMLTDIYGAIQGIHPDLKVSAAVWGIYDNTKLPQGQDKATGYSWTSSGLQNYMQDSIGWINAGCMDALVPMIYWNMGDIKPDYDELLFSFVSSVRNGRHIYGGQRVFTPEEMLREVVATNLIGAQGTVPFTLNRISREDMAQFYRKYIYPEPAPVPQMWWKNHPKTGTILVTVQDAQGKPVTDAQVKLEGQKKMALSSADGFCAIIGVDPGDFALTADKQGVGTSSAKAQIHAGQVVRRTLTLKAPEKK